MVNSKIYVINLDNEPDKWENVQKQLNGSVFQFERFSAIDGSKLSNREKKLMTTGFCNKFCTNTMIGCFLSHLSIWRLALKENLELKNSKVVALNFKLEKLY
jgi:glycosyl transferase family 25